MKLRLSSSVVFSALAGYLLGSKDPQFYSCIILIFAGVLVTGSANSFNQIFEIEFDMKMKRTSNRPLPQKKISVFQAVFFSLIIGFAGLFLLLKINPKCFFFGLLSIIMYVFAYTPLKRKTPLSIFIGAVPGAIPFLLGWVAATNDFGLESGFLFAIQFLWQIPHFIAISWVLDNEYKHAGFKMMIGGKKSNLATIIILISCVLLTITSIIPYFILSNDLNLSALAVLLILILGIYFIFRALVFCVNKTDNNAKKIQFFSYFYLPLLQMIYVFDKFLAL